MSTVDFDRLYTGDPDPWGVASSWYERRKTDLLLACLRRERYRLAWDLGCGTGEFTARLARRCDRVLATDSSARACQITLGRCADQHNVTVERSAAPDLPVALHGARDTGPGSGHDTGPGSGHDTGPGSGHDTGPDSGPRTRPDSGPRTRPDSGSDKGPDSGSDKGPDSESCSADLADLVVISEMLYYLSAQQRRAVLQTVLPVCAPDADLVAVHWTARPEEARVSGLRVHRELDERLLAAGWGRLIAHRDLEFMLTLWSREVPATMGR